MLITKACVRACVSTDWRMAALARRRRETKEYNNIKRVKQKYETSISLFPKVHFQLIHGQQP
jgi:hypothetical protein